MKMNKKEKKRRKIQSDETREGEIELTGRQNLRISAYNVIIDRLNNEMERRKTAYDELNSLFGFFISAGKEDLDTETLTEHSRKSVSYTHLDVYKRQFLFH